MSAVGGACLGGGNEPAGGAAPDEASQIAAAEEQPVEIAVPEFNVSPELEVGATPRPECSDPRLTQKIVEKSKLISPNTRQPCSLTAAATFCCAAIFPVSAK